MQLCVAATMTWALVFGADPTNQCFADKDRCETAAMGANAAFEKAYNAGSEIAHCDEQPAALSVNGILIPWQMIAPSPK
jgi:hypothetical protein